MSSEAPDSWFEDSLVIPCLGERLVAIVCKPSNSPPACGLVIVTGGPQYRAGAHRHFVQLARELARLGHLVLRFDARGMGDSTGHHQGFEGIGADIEAAVSLVRTKLPTDTPLALWGLCDGASAAALYVARSTTRVHGLAMLNPWVRTEATLAQTRVRFWYLKRLRQLEFWRKLTRGGIGMAALGGLIKNLHQASAAPIRANDYRAGMLLGVNACPTTTLVHISDGDITGLEFKAYAEQDPGWQRSATARKWKAVTLHGADHTLTQEAARQQLVADIDGFLRSLTRIKPAP